MSWYLAFDTSTPRSVIVLGRIAGPEHELVVSDALEDGANQASATLGPRIDHMLARAAIAPDRLAAIGCGQGPGTFTGTRVALATAKGLCSALRCRLYPLSTLASVAAGLAYDGPVLAALDARRGEVYGGLYRCRTTPPSLQLEGEARCCTLAELLATVDETTRARLNIVGSGVEPYREQLPEWLRARAIPERGVGPRGLWHTLVTAVTSGLDCNVASADAVYLRQSYAELGINKPKRPVTRSPFV